MDERLDQIGFTLQSSLGLRQVSIQFRKVVACDIGQIRQFQIAPHPLGRVEFWSIAREAFEMKALGGSRSQVVFDELGAMGWTAIPDHQEQARDQTLKDRLKNRSSLPRVPIIRVCAAVLPCSIGEVNRWTSEPQAPLPLLPFPL